MNIAIFGIRIHDSQGDLTDTSAKTISLIASMAVWLLVKKTLKNKITFIRYFGPKLFSFTLIMNEFPGDFTKQIR